MPKKKNADNEQVMSADATAAPAPAKKRASTTGRKSAAATHKSPARRSAAKTAGAPGDGATAPPVAETDSHGVALDAVETAVSEALPAAPAKNLLDPVAAREEIARMAYSYWEERNFLPGDPLHDWLRAEEEFRSRQYATA